MCKKIFNSFMLYFIPVCFSHVIMATPTSTTPANVVMLRPYVNGEIFIQVSSNVLCNTAVFKIGADAGRDIMYSAALSALMGNKKIIVEALTSTGCTGWGTKLQSIYLYPTN